MVGDLMLNGVVGFATTEPSPSNVFLTDRPLTSIWGFWGQATIGFDGFR